MSSNRINERVQITNTVHIISRTIYLVACACLISSTAMGQGFIDERDALEGLYGVYVMGGDLDDNLTASGLQKQDVIASVTSRLINGGIRVLEETEWLMLDDAPVLHINLQSSVDDEEHTLYSVELEVFYLVNPISRPDFSAYAVAWGQGKFGVLGDDGAQKIMDDLGHLVDRLTSDYNAVNS